MRKGSREPTIRGREICRYNFAFRRKWQGKYYAIKLATGRVRPTGGQVAPVIKEEANEIIVITAIHFTFEKEPSMKISYDPKIDALYIRLLRGKHECRSIRLSEEVALNIGPGEKLVGIEILDAELTQMKRHRAGVNG